MERFIQIIKNDIKRTFKVFKNNERLRVINPKDNNILSLDPNYMLELLYTSCSVDKTELFTGERMALFKELFLKGLSNFTISYIKGILIGNKENILILNLYTSLLTKKLYLLYGVRTENFFNKSNDQKT